MPGPKGRAEGPERGTPPRLAPLDGIRGLAVLAVLAYHAGVAGTQGGLLGVDVFFVLSGFLITGLLCAEHVGRAAIGLGRFWGRRARRLLPALFLGLLLVAVYAAVFHGSVDAGAIRGDAFWTLFYAANWHFIAAGQGYFAQSAAPSPLLHMWSLAVEEQYYLVWPLVAVVVLRLRGTRTLAWVAGLGAAGSALAMLGMQVGHVSVDRMYYGTDTRAQALLVGSALGAVASERDWTLVPAVGLSARRTRRTVAWLGAGGLCFLLVAWHSFGGQSRFLYEGGFLLVALASAALITSVVSLRSSALARALSAGPLVYVGRISYGLYVYHWPLFLIIDHARTGLGGVPLLLARLSATCVAAVLSFHVVEEPVRRWRPRVVKGAALATSSAVAVAAVISLSTITPATAATPYGPVGLSVAEHGQLAAAGAFTSHPISVVVLGDSVAATAAVGLSHDSLDRYGVVVHNAAVPGCDLDFAPVRFGSVVYRPYRSLNCGSWRTDFSRVMDAFRPDVAALLIGRFDLADHEHGGIWVHVGEPRFDARIAGLLGGAVGLLSAHRTPVVLFTFPYLGSAQEQANGSPVVDRSPARVDAYNRIVRQVASEHPGTVTLIDLNRILDPKGRYTTTIDGTVVRWPADQMHVTVAGGEWLQGRVLPEIAAVGLEARARH